MSREGTLRYLQNLSGMREQDLRRSLQAQQQLVQQLRNKYALLQTYVQQYRQESAAREGVGIVSTEVIRWRAFIQQLAALLVQQDELIREQEQRLQLVLEQWRAIKAKEQGFSRLLQRLADERQLAELRKMQKEMDAWALRATQLRSGR